MKRNRARVRLSKKLKPFGYQMVLAVYGCTGNICDNIDLCYNFLDDLVRYIGMNKQSEPVIVRTDHIKYPDKKGLSGCVFLVESSIVIHTLSLRNFLTVDVYSCKKFGAEKVKEFVRQYFFPAQVKIEKKFFILRGKEYFKMNFEQT